MGCSIPVFSREGARGCKRERACRQESGCSRCLGAAGMRSGKVATCTRGARESRGGSSVLQPLSHFQKESGYIV